MMTQGPKKSRRLWAVALAVLTTIGIIFAIAAIPYLFFGNHPAPYDVQAMGKNERLANDEADKLKFPSFFEISDRTRDVKPDGTGTLLIRRYQSVVNPLDIKEDVRDQLIANGWVYLGKKVDDGTISNDFLCKGIFNAYFYRGNRPSMRYKFFNFSLEISTGQRGGEIDWPASCKE